MVTPNQKINLLLYVGAQSVYGGNLIASLRCLADYVRSRGGKVIWMFPVGASERDWFKSLAQDEDVETYDRSLGFIPRARQLRKTISKKQINVVHIHFSDIAVPLAASFGKNVRIVRHVHSDFTLGHTETGPREFIKRAKDCVLDVVQMFTGKAVNICVSPFLASQFKGAYVPNAIAPSHIRQVSIDEMRKKRIEVGVKATDTCVLMFGWSPLVKGLDIAVDAVERLNEYGGGVMLLVVCGEDSDVAKKYIDNRCTCGSQAPFIKYLPPIEDVSLYHAISDVLLSSSRSEGFSTSLMEALLLKKACVTSDIEGTGWSKRYESVFQFISGDSASCADALKRAIEWSRERESVDTLGRVANQVAADYSIEKWCEMLLATYRGN